MSVEDGDEVNLQGGGEEKNGIMANTRNAVELYNALFQPLLIVGKWQHDRHCPSFIVVFLGVSSQLVGGFFGP